MSVGQASMIAKPQVDTAGHVRVLFPGSEL